MDLCRLFRLMVALLALGAAMAGSASATRAMAVPVSPMPCHETAFEPASNTPAILAGMPVASGAVASVFPASGSDAPLPHLCCVLSLLVTPPLAAPVLALPAPRATALDVPVTAALEGLAWPAPVPPPRSL